MRENDRSCAVSGNARRLAASVTGLSKLRTLSACAVLALAPGAAPANWSGTNGLYSVQQTPDDIVVKTSGRIVFSARNFAAAQYAKLLAEFEVPAAPSSTSPSLHVRHAFHLVSLTGSLLALRDGADIDVSGNAIPAGRTRFWTIDLRKGAHYGFGDDPLGPSPKSPGAFVNLRSLFPERTIAAAVAKTDLGRTGRVEGRFRPPRGDVRPGRVGSEQPELLPCHPGHGLELCDWQDAAVVHIGRPRVAGAAELPHAAHPAASHVAQVTDGIRSAAAPACRAAWDDHGPWPSNETMTLRGDPKATTASRHLVPRRHLRRALPHGPEPHRPALRPRPWRPAQP